MQRLEKGLCEPAAVSPWRCVSYAGCKSFTSLFVTNFTSEHILILVTTEVDLSNGTLPGPLPNLRLSEPPDPAANDMDCSAGDER